MGSDSATITDAVVLMAGTGSRLRAGGHEIPKPLISLGGRPIISSLLESFRNVGVRKLHAVVGANSDRLLVGLRPLVPPEIELNAIQNSEWKKQNGISLLCAEPHVAGPFLLTMADHLFDFAVIEALVRQSDRAQLNLAIDRKIDSVFDLNDAMKVKTRDGFVTAIGKTLSYYDAIDTGAFLCPREIFFYLHAAEKNGDCSLADGVRAMAEVGKVRAIDVGAAWWQDVDTPEMLREADRVLREIRPVAVQPAPAAK